MAAQHPEIVIVRRRGSHEDEHHGGAWKIAFADFMTAMMAFFLVLWIISATDKNTKTLIARYFNPVKVEEPAKAQKGIHGVPEKDAYQPGAGSAAPSAGKSASDRAEPAGGPDGEAAPTNPSSQGEQRRPPTPQSPEPPQDPARPYPTMSEQELFSDPRASLTRSPAPAAGASIHPSAALKGYGEAGRSADEALRDPFRPLGSDRAINVVRSDTGAPPAAAAAGDLPASEEASSPPEAPGAGSKQGSGSTIAGAVIGLHRPRPTPPRRAGPQRPTCLPT